MIMQGLGSSYGTMDPMNYHWLGNLSTYATEIMKKKKEKETVEMIDTLSNWK